MPLMPLDAVLSADIPATRTQNRQQKQKSGHLSALISPEDLQQVIQDILHHEEAKRRYVNRLLNCPASYQSILGRYKTVLKDDQKSH